MTKFNQLEWGQKIVPTPFTKQMLIPKVEEEFFYVSVSIDTETSLKLSNLTLNKSVYCLEAQGESPIISVTSTVPYVLYADQMPFLSGDTNTFTVEGFSCKALKTELNRWRITTDKPVSFRLVDDESNVIYDNALDGELEIEYEGAWLAFENPTRTPVTFEVIPL